MSDKIIHLCCFNNEAVCFLIDQIDIGLEADDLSPEAFEMIEDFRAVINNYERVTICMPPI